MKNYRNFLFISFVIAAVSLSGCASSAPSRFYTLHGPGDGSAPSRASAAESKIFIGIGPVEIPDYLNRPQIVTRSGLNELNYAEYDRWAGSFEDEVARVLAENISVQLADRQMSVLPWGSFATSSFPFKYRLAVSIMRFEGALKGSVVLKAQWTLYDESGKKVLLMRDSSISEQAQGNDYASLVEAMSRAIAKLSDEVASAIAVL